MGKHNQNNRKKNKGKARVVQPNFQPTTARNSRSQPQYRHGKKNDDETTRASSRTKRCWVILKYLAKPFLWLAAISSVIAGLLWWIPDIEVGVVDNDRLPMEDRFFIKNNGPLPIWNVWYRTHVTSGKNVDRPATVTDADYPGIKYPMMWKNESVTMELMSSSNTTDGIYTFDTNQDSFRDGASIEGPAVGTNADGTRFIPVGAVSDIPEGGHACLLINVFYDYPWFWHHHKTFQFYTHVYDGKYIWVPYQYGVPDLNWTITNLPYFKK